MKNDSHQLEPGRLRAAEAGELVEHVAAATGGGMPLDEAFRALAEDTGNRQLRRVAERLASEMAQGADLTAAMGAVRGDLPAYLRHALAASTAGGQTVAVLEGLAHHETTRRRLRRQMTSALLYPIIVLGLTLAVVSGLSMFVVPQFEEIYVEMELELPTLTVFLLSVSKLMPWVLGIVVAIPVAYALLAVLPEGRRLQHWVRGGLPLFGRLWIWSAHHEFASVLGSLTAQGVTLEEALVCTEASLRDRNLARATRIAARKCEQGMRLSQSLGESLHFDRALPALVSWGEAQDALPEALRQATAQYEEEIDLHTVFLRRILPPLLFLTVVGTLALFVLALMVPLVDLINNLSG